MGCVSEENFETGYDVEENFLMDSCDKKNIMKECAAQNKSLMGCATKWKVIPTFLGGKKMFNGRKKSLQKVTSYPLILELKAVLFNIEELLRIKKNWHAGR